MSETQQNTEQKNKQAKCKRASLVAQTVKNLPAMQETGDPLKEKMATYSSILAGRIPWT